MNPEQLMKTVVEAFGRADVQPLLEALDENLVWRSGCTTKQESLLFGGTYLNRAGAIEHISKLSTAYFFQHYTAKEIVSQGEIVWGLFDVAGSYLPPGGRELDRKAIHFETAIRMRIRGGKIMECVNFFDTAAVIQQHAA